MSTALVHLETLPAVEIFKPGAIDPILGAIKTEVRRQASELDISTEANRKAIASLAFKVAKSKTFIDEQRKALVADEKKRLKKIDEEGARIWSELESLQKEIRQPLTDWEQAEKNRVAAHERELTEIANAGTETQGNWKALGSVCIQERIREVETDPHNWEEFATRAAGVKALAIHQMRESLALAQKDEAEAAELARLRAEAAEREKKEREETIAREATLKAERAAEAERKRLEAERLQAEARARQAEEQREQAAQKAARDAQEAAERAEREKQAAIEAERQRVEQEKRRAEAEEQARQRDKAHKTKIHNEAKTALLAQFEGAPFCMNPATAEAVVIAIAEGQIPNVKVVY